MSTPNEGNTPEKGNRRTFIKRSAALAISITLVDLIHSPVQASETITVADPTCNAMDPDLTCGNKVLEGINVSSLTDSDSACNTKNGGVLDSDGNCGKDKGDNKSDEDEACKNNSDGSALHDPDGSCSLQTNINSSAQDNDGSCGWTIAVTNNNHTFDTDETCAYSAPGTPEKEEADERCNMGLPGRTGNDIDENCKNTTEKDEFCQAQSTGHYDQDEYCGLGTPPDQDQACNKGTPAQDKDDVSSYTA